MLVHCGKEGILAQAAVGYWLFPDYLQR